MTYAHKDGRIYGHKDVYFFIFEIGELNALGHKSAFKKSIFLRAAETYERKTQELYALRT